MTPAEHLHDLLLEVVGLELQPGLCQQISDRLLDGYVPAGEAEDRHAEGLYTAAEAYPLIREARDIISRCSVWEGPETWRDDSVAALEKIVHVLRPLADKRTEAGDAVVASSQHLPSSS